MSATVTTPRGLDPVELRVEVADWLRAIESALSLYLCLHPQPRRMVKRSVTQLGEGKIKELLDGSFNLGSAERRSLTKQERVSAKERFDQITDIEILRVTSSCAEGGAGRTPVGSFANQITEAYGEFCGSEKAELLDQVLNRVGSLLCSVRAAAGVLETSLSVAGKKMPEGGASIESPSLIDQRLRRLIVSSLEQGRSSGQNELDKALLSPRSMAPFHDGVRDSLKKIGGMAKELDEKLALRFNELLGHLKADGRKLEGWEEKMEKDGLELAQLDRRSDLFDADPAISGLQNRAASAYILRQHLGIARTWLVPFCDEGSKTDG